MNVPQIVQWIEQVDEHGRESPQVQETWWDSRS